MSFSMFFLSVGNIHTILYGSSLFAYVECIIKKTEFFLKKIIFPNSIISLHILMPTPDTMSNLSSEVNEII